MKKQVLCIFGGMSSEYEVSLRSVCTVLEALDTEKYDVHKLGITRDGKWYLYTGKNDSIADNTWHKDTPNLSRAMLSPDFGDGFLYVETSPNVRHFVLYPIDVIIPVVHGAYAEDGKLQGLLSMSGIPYVGPHCTASAISMDKAYTKLILNNYDIPQAKCAIISRALLENDPDAAIAQAEAIDAYPLFVKPANAGSSVGASKANDRTALLAALKLAAEHDDKILVEECIIGREVECAVLGNLDPETTVPGEIDAGAEFYDYEAKYITSTSSAYIPARIKEETQEAVRTYAKRIYEILGCKGLSRVDFFVTTEGNGEEKIIFNEINTLPGFTSISMYPKLWNHMGTSTTALLDELITLAIRANKH